jgi:hypothetical protein
MKLAPKYADDSLLITMSGFQPLRTYLHLPGAMPQAFTFRAVGAPEFIFGLLGRWNF